MPNSEGLIAAAGSLAFAGNLAEQKQFPDNGVKIVAATIALVLIASFTRNSAIAPPVKALAALMLLGSMYRYIPAFTRKVKSNG